MNNLKNRNEFVNEMQIIRQVQKEENDFNKKEIMSLENNDDFVFDMVSKNKAVCQLKNYKLSIYKRKSNDFLFRIRDTKNTINSVLHEEKRRSLRDCLYEIDELMVDLLKKDKEREELERRIKLGEIEKPKQNIFAGKSFSGKGYM